MSTSPTSDDESSWSILTDPGVKNAFVQQSASCFLVSSDTENEEGGIRTDEEVKNRMLMTKKQKLSTANLPFHESKAGVSTDWWVDKYSWAGSVATDGSDGVEEVHHPPDDHQVSVASANSGDTISDSDCLPSAHEEVTYSSKLNRNSTSLSSITSMMNAKTPSSSGMQSISTELKPKRGYNSTKRSAKRKLDLSGKGRKGPAKASLFMDKAEMAKVLTKRCCDKCCLQGGFDFSDLHSIRRSLEGLHHTEVNSRLMANIRWTFNKNSRNDDSSSKGKYMFPLPSGQEVCAEAQALVYAVSIRHFRTLTKLVREGATGKCREPRSSHVGAWRSYLQPYLEDYASTFGSQMPNSNKIELNVGSKVQIYMKFLVLKEGVEALKDKPFSESWFYRLWRLCCPHILCPRQNSFSKCDKCVLFKTALEKLSDRKQRVKAVRNFDAHLVDQMNERKQYYANRLHAIAHPEEAISMIVDGMAQKKTNLPFWPRGPPKCASMKMQYDLHVMGVIIHRFHPLVVVHDTTVGTGPNMLCDVVWRAINSVPVPKLPPLLYLQLDNTASDNKNHWVMEFCAMLVQQRIFKEVIFRWNNFSLP